MLQSKQFVGCMIALLSHSQVGYEVHCALKENPYSLHRGLSDPPVWIKHTRLCIYSFCINLSHFCWIRWFKTLMCTNAASSTKSSSEFWDFNHTAHIFLQATKHGHRTRILSSFKCGSWDSQMLNSASSLVPLPFPKPHTTLLPLYFLLCLFIDCIQTLPIPRSLCSKDQKSVILPPLHCFFFWADSLNKVGYIEHADIAPGKLHLAQIQPATQAQLYWARWNQCFIWLSNVHTPLWLKIQHAYCFVEASSCAQLPFMWVCFVSWTAISLSFLWLRKLAAFPHALLVARAVLCNKASTPSRVMREPQECACTHVTVGNNTRAHESHKPRVIDSGNLTQLKTRVSVESTLISSRVNLSRAPWLKVPAVCEAIILPSG